MDKQVYYVRREITFKGEGTGKMTNDIYLGELLHTPAVSDRLRYNIMSDIANDNQTTIKEY